MTEELFLQAPNRSELQASRVHLLRLLATVISFDTMGFISEAGSVGWGLLGPRNTNWSPNAARGVGGWMYVQRNTE